MTFEVRKISYPMQVNVVDGVPQCPCCQEPMVKRDEGWMCAIGAAAMDLLSQWTARLDDMLPTTVTQPGHILAGIGRSDDGLAKRARCECGWIGDWTDEGDARAEHAAHAREGTA